MFESVDDGRTKEIEAIELEKYLDTYVVQY